MSARWEQCIKKEETEAANPDGWWKTLSCLQFVLQWAKMSLAYSEIPENKVTLGNQILLLKQIPA